MSQEEEKEIEEEISEDKKEVPDDFLNMSDEDFMNTPIPDEIPLEEDSNKKAEEEAEEEEKEEEEIEDEEESSENDKESDESEDGGNEEDEEDVISEDISDDDEAEEEQEQKPKRKKLKLEKPEDDKEEEVKEETASDDIDYKAEYNKIMAPFKANGKMISLSKPEDVISLMSMGANYNKKMQAIKPHLKYIKMLDNNDLLDESKISYAIDLMKGNKDAIEKLIKDSGIDPLNVDIEEDSKYKVNTDYNVSEKEVDLDQVLDEIQHTDSYKETIEIVSTKWDEASKGIILENPEVLKTINDQVGNGIYGQIAEVMERERVLGHLNGLSDLQAYEKIGDYMNKNELFKEQQAEKSKIITPTPKKKKVDPKLKKQKLAAGGTKNAPSKGKQPDYDPLALSDEEFEKLSANDLF